MGVDPQAGPDRKRDPGDRTGTGPEVVPPVLAVDAALDRVPAQRHGVLRDPQRKALGDGDLLGHQVHPGDRLGDRVLHLDAGVHLQEVERAAPGIDEELHRAGAAVVQPAGVRDSRLMHARPQVLVETGRGSLLDQLLVAPLDRAVPVAEMDGVRPVREDLHLHMAAGCHVPLEIEPGIAESGARLGGRPFECRLQRRRLGDQAQSAATATAGRLDEHGPAHLLGERPGLGQPAHLAAGDDREAGFHGVPAGGEFVADHRELFGGGADERDPGPRTRLGQARVLGQEPVSRVDRVRPDGSGGGHHRVHVEVARRRRWRPKADHLIREACRHAGEIRLGRAQHRLDAQPLAGTNDPDRDLSPVGDQQTADRHSIPAVSVNAGRGCRDRGCARRPGRRTPPDRPAGRTSASASSPCPAWPAPSARRARCSAR